MSLKGQSGVDHRAAAAALAWRGAMELAKAGARSSVSGRTAATNASALKNCKR